MYEARTVVGRLENGKTDYGLTTTHPDVESAVEEALNRQNPVHVVLAGTDVIAIRVDYWADPDTGTVPES
jgi:hypothetical protein